MTTTEAIQVLKTAVLAALVSVGDQGALLNQVNKHSGINNDEIVSNLLWLLKSEGLAALPHASKLWRITALGRRRASELIMAHTTKPRPLPGNDDVPSVE